MDTTNFREILNSLQYLTASQKRHLISRTKMSLDDEAGMLVTTDLLTKEELDALLAPAPSLYSRQ